MLLTAKILLTLLTLAYSVIPTRYDLTETHATNPSWTPHARWHVVWQVASYDFIALISLVLIWTAGDDTAQLWVPMLLAMACFGGFWTAFLTKHIYGGTAMDEVNGVPEYHWNILGRKFTTDRNITQFTPITLLTLFTLFLVARLNGYL